MIGQNQHSNYITRKINPTKKVEIIKRSNYNILLQMQPFPMPNTIQRKQNIKSAENPL